MKKSTSPPTTLGLPIILSRWRIWTAKQGENVYNAKLTAAQVLYIRENPDGLNLEQLAEKFNVTQTTIGEVQLGKTYKNVGGPIRGKIERRTPDDQREEIIARYNEGGISQYALAKEFGVSQMTVSNIVNGK